MELKVIAHIHTNFSEKFGIPRQSGIVPSVGKIVFEPEYRVAEAFKGLDGYSHLWLIWQFSKNPDKKWSPTVRPPRLGGNKRVGVFATRSPFRPNSIGLSSVEIVSIENDASLGPVITVKGADLLDNTPIFDIKPYLAYTDSHQDAVGGFADGVFDYSLKVEFPQDVMMKIPEEYKSEVIAMLENDPRPSYHCDPDRIYGMNYAGFEIKFSVKNNVIKIHNVSNIS